MLLIPMGPIADSFRPFLTEEALAGSYQLIAYHQRGQAGSTRTPPPVSFAEHAADAAALLDHLGIQRAHIAGHSTVSVTALQLASTSTGAHPAYSSPRMIGRPPRPSWRA